jgi:hypothetical protein
MQCHELDLVFEQQGFAPLSAEAREHLAQCSACKSFVADVTHLVAFAHELPSEVEPPEHVWLSIQQELVREGTIREFSRGGHAESAAPWWQSLAELFRGRTLAIAGVGMVLVVAAMLVTQKPEVTVLQPHGDDYGSTVTVLSQQEHDLANMQLASTGASVGETSAVDISLRQNLQQVDEFIADCERRVKDEPSDDLAREYLTNAYQQKAELLSAMMDRGGSLN